jgi:hypothetical protein
MESVTATITVWLTVYVTYKSGYPCHNKALVITFSIAYAIYPDRYFNVHQYGFWFDRLYINCTATYKWEG